MMTELRRPLVIGVAGGTGSGKTTVVSEIQDAVSDDNVVVVHQDNYYRDYGHLPLEERARVNFDHPDAIEAELVEQHVRDLTAGRSVEVPIYDFETHTRSEDTSTLAPARVVIIDGILVLAEAGLRALMDIKIFVDTDPDLRLIRRIDRDVRERGRTVESVVEQYQATVRPMHLQFVEPSKRHADLIVPEGGQNRVAVETIATAVRSALP